VGEGRVAALQEGQRRPDGGPVAVEFGVELGQRGRAFLGRDGAQLVAQGVEPGRREELQHQPEGQVVLAGVHAAGAQEAGEVGGGRIGRVELRHRRDE